jgi:hypothetical protein
LRESSREALEKKRRGRRRRLSSVPQGFKAGISGKNTLHLPLV